VQPTGSSRGLGGLQSAQSRRRPPSPSGLSSGLSTSDQRRGSLLSNTGGAGSVVSAYGAGVAGPAVARSARGLRGVRLRDAMAIREILDKPVGLRDPASTDAIAG